MQMGENISLMSRIHTVNAHFFFWGSSLNAFTAGNPFLGQNTLGISIGRVLRALNGSRDSIAPLTTTDY